MRLRTALLVPAVALGLAGLTACSSPSDGPGNAPSTAVPSADVLTSLKTDTALHAKLPAAIAKAGSISFGTVQQPGTSGLPYAGTLGGRNVGLHFDLADAVAKVLGVKADDQFGTFPTIVTGAQNGKFDVGLANLGVTAEREQVVDFATYLTDGQSFLAAKSVKVDKVTTLTDLCGLTIGTSPGSTFQQILENGKNDCAKAGKKPYSVQYFSTSAPILLGLQNGKLDVEFGPTLSVKYDAAHIPGTKFLGQLSVTPVGFVTAKGSALTPVLRDAVNELIRNGVYGKILAKWGVTSSGIKESVLNPKPTL